ncbi:MAG: T9SS type A sorting domain-containing protein [Crocinitomicaceae bacterium]|nr:T9SS type A sorting domain-containing protein [Crocinitomicaceae bacterium]
MKNFTNLLNLFFAFILSHSLFAQTCINPTGSQAASGTGSWIAHVYDHNGSGNPVTNPFALANYKGHYTETETFNRNWGTGKPDCATAADNFAVRFRMTKSFSCGSYVFTIGGDDGVRLSIDGGSNWLTPTAGNGWTDQSYKTYTFQPVLLNGSTNLVLEYYEKGGVAQVSFGYTVTTGPIPVKEVTAGCSASPIQITGYVAGNYTYAWTGTPINNATIYNPTVSPITTTTYTLVTSTIPSGCSITSSVKVNITSPSGDPAVFGENAWNVYGYNGNSTTLSNNNYRGRYIQPVLSTTNFGVNTQNYWSNGKSPSVAGTTIDNGNLWSGCTTTDDAFTFVHKRKGFPCGNYTFTMTNWDDETRVIIDGVNIWSCSNWSGGGGNNSNSSTFHCGNTRTFTANLDANSKVEIQTFEGSGLANLAVSITANTPTALASTSSRTCATKGSTWIDFIDANKNLVASINPNGNDLGNVTMNSYVATPGVMSACAQPTNPSFQTAYLGRTWVMTSTAYPTGANFPTNVSVRLPFTNSELAALNTTAQNTTTANPMDGGNTSPATASNLMLTKITGATENGIANSADCASTIRAVMSASNGVTPNSIAATSFVDFNIGQFSEFFLHKNINNSPLPVKLTNFSASCDQNVILNWSTASEQNSDKFILEKSRDGLEWIAFAEQAAAGNSNTNIDYQQVDHNAWNGITYYRLRQLDFNGEQEVFGPISTSCEGNISNSMVVYPNPNNGSFTVEITSKEAHQGAELLLTDITGKVIHSQIATIKTGVNQLKINKIDIQSGTYFVLLSGKHSKIKPVKVVVEF